VYKRQTYLQRIQPYRVEDSIEGIVLTLTDISAMKEAEKAQRNIMTLTEISQELPDFAYAVSHDLQAPLRHISQYSQILDAAIEKDQKQEVLKASRVIRDGSVSLRNLIDGLLTYSRVNTLGKPLEKVSLTVVVNAAVLQLRSFIDSVDAKITVQPDLPFVLGDPRQLKELFCHLIDNSLKYRSEAAPVINISSEKIDDEVHVSVSDNGIGIDSTNAEAVFTIFKRLGFKESVPGAGVGLAICRRIALRHHGRIWLSESPEGGAQFSFNLKTPDYLADSPQS